MDRLNWYALRVKPKMERTAAELLRRNGVEDFLPLQRGRQKWAHGERRMDTPLFPGYIFCRVVLNGPYRVVKTPGVVGFVGLGGEPEAVPEEQIQAVRRMLDSGRRLQPLALLHEGQRVRVDAGPLAGMDGVLTKIRDEQHLVVSLELLQRSVAVTLEGDAVSPYA